MTDDIPDDLSGLRIELRYLRKEMGEHFGRVEKALDEAAKSESAQWASLRRLEGEMATCADLEKLERKTHALEERLRSQETSSAEARVKLTIGAAVAAALMASVVSSLFSAFGK